jgi:hypothetical protein
MNGPSALTPQRSAWTTSAGECSAGAIAAPLATHIRTVDWSESNSAKQAADVQLLAGRAREL